MKKYYWIKERQNPQTGTYYVACNNNYTVKEARKAEKPRYGTNTMHKFNNEADYTEELTRLQKTGKKVHASQE